MSIPKECKLSPINKNVEGLRSHLQLLMFIPEDIDALARQRRAWLVHLIVKASRHYNAARVLVIDQIHNASTSTGVRFPIWDFGLEMEDCITSLAKALTLLNSLSALSPTLRVAQLEFLDEKKAVWKMRNKQEHLFTHLASGQIEEGAVIVMVDESGDNIVLGKQRLAITSLHAIISHVFDVVATMCPQFDTSSTPQAAGITHLSMTATMEVHTIGST